MCRSMLATEAVHDGRLSSREMIIDILIECDNYLIRTMYSRGQKLLGHYNGFMERHIVSISKLHIAHKTQSIYCTVTSFIDSANANVRVYMRNIRGNTVKK